MRVSEGFLIPPELLLQVMSQEEYEAFCNRYNYAMTPLERLESLLVQIAEAVVKSNSTYNKKIDLSLPNRDEFYSKMFHKLRRSSRTRRDEEKIMEQNMALYMMVHNNQLRGT
jgi:tRNA G26 N,N-dimethylase Trm1